jgi:glycine/D-amino acid oxidase-like deaminating enzyme
MTRNTSLRRAKTVITLGATVLCLCEILQIHSANAGPSPSQLAKSLQTFLNSVTREIPEFVAPSAEETLGLVAAGKSKSAAMNYQSAAAQLRAYDTPAAREAAQRFDDIAKQLNIPRPPVPAAAPRDVLSTIPNTLTAPAGQSLFQRLEQSAWRARPIDVVQADVRVFKNEVVDGAYDQDFYLSTVRDSESWLVVRWTLAPVQYRVFFAGSHSDSPAIQAVADQLEEQGFVTFFYEDCRRIDERLCDSHVVGAFLGSAGHAILVNTAAAQASAFTRQEGRIANALREGRSVGLLFTPRELLGTGVAGSASAVAFYFNESR